MSSVTGSANIPSGSRLSEEGEGEREKYTEREGRREGERELLEGGGEGEGREKQANKMTMPYLHVNVQDVHTSE